MRSKDKMLEVAEKHGTRSVRYLRRLIIYTCHKLGTQKSAAKVLGIPYSTFRRWVNKLRIRL